MIGDIRKFRFWCQKVLPLVYDDSLSYYEVLCKIVHYLNKVIEDVNSIPDYIDGVIEERISDEHIVELIHAFVTNLEAAISAHQEGSNTNSSSDYNIGDMLWLNDKLYKVIRKIDAGDTFIVDTNIELDSFENLFHALVDKVTHFVTNNDAGQNETATFPSEAKDWLIWNDKLYEVIANIPTGSAYVEGVNIEPRTIEELFNELLIKINDRLHLFIHVKNYGAVGDGTTNDTRAFVNAIADSSNGYIFATNGTYKIDNNVDLNGNVLVLSNATLTNDIVGKVIRVDNGNVFSNYQKSVTTSPYWQNSPAIKAGGQIMDVGMQIGSANNNQGDIGTNFYSDGHSDYLAFKPNTQLNPVEINLYSSEMCGELDVTSGSDIVVQNNSRWVADRFHSKLVGLPIQIENYGTFKIIELISPTSVRIAKYDGSAISIPTGTYTFSIVITTYHGIVNVDGSEVTRVSGSPFLGYLTTPHSLIRINGVDYTVNTVIDAEHLIISGNAGTLSNVEYYAYGDIEGESSALRINMGVGEQLTIQANKQDNCFYIKTDGGALHKWRDVIIESSNHPNGIRIHADDGKISFRSTYCPSFADGYIYGDFATEHLSTKGMGIVNWNYATDDGSIDVNFRGENYTTSYYRDFCVYNGKEGLMVKADGSANEVIFSATPKPNTPNYVNVGDPTNIFKSYYAGDGFRFKPVYGLANDSHKLGLDFIKNLVTHTFEYDNKEKQGILTSDFWSALTNHGGDANCTIMQNDTIETFEMVVALVNAVKDINTRFDGKTLATTSGNGTNASKLATLKTTFDTLTNNQKERCYIVQNDGHIYHISNSSGIFRCGDPSTNLIGFLTLDLANGVFKNECWGTGGYVIADYSSGTSSNFSLKII